jgi:hypothetical protein
MTSTENKLTTQGFLAYLSGKRPRFYNGLTSTYCTDSLDSGSHCFQISILKFLLNGKEVARVFQDPDIGAITGTPSNPLLTFFRPDLILFPSSGRNLGNEATIFHEALHGLTGQFDSATILRPQGLLEKLGFNSNDPICKITRKIEDSVLSKSVGLDPTTSSCP